MELHPLASWVPEENLAALNKLEVAQRDDVLSTLRRARREQAEFVRGTNRYAMPERAVLRAVSDERLVFETQNFEPPNSDQLFMTFGLEGHRFIFSCRLLAHGRGVMEVTVPAALYRSERRDRPRYAKEAPDRVSVSWGAECAEGEVVDEGAGGVGIRVRGVPSVKRGDILRLEFEARRGRAGAVRFGSVRSMSDPDVTSGWRRIGLAESHCPSRVSIREEHLRQIPRPKFHRAARRLRFESRRISYFNKSGEEIRAIVDVLGCSRGAPAVVIPPAWGRTKESTVGFADAVIATFESLGAAVVVVRFDGIRRRGESHNDPGCTPPIDTNLHYTFSQGVEDIRETVAFLKRDPAYRSQSIVLATVSIAAVEARRAIAIDDGVVAGWVCLVGVSDPQWMIRVVSGGIDYFGGASRSLEFGIQYIQGLRLDVDRATHDAIGNEIAFLDDARRDMASISVPIVWICGDHDAWTPIERVRDILSSGTSANERRLIRLPIGHQLRNSDDADRTFGLAASEIARIVVGRPVEPSLASTAATRRRRRAERRMLQRPLSSLREFWHDYIVGRDERIGFELIAATTAYQEFMSRQLSAMELEDGDVVVDLGSGTGSLPLAIASDLMTNVVTVVEIDLVPAALRRARKRLEGKPRNEGLSVEYVAADLDADRRGGAIPLADDSADVILASLLVNYVAGPQALLREMARILKPGGRLVVSGMKPDADISKICVQGVAEIRLGTVETALDGEVDKPLQDFISNGARLLDLEEDGAFNFWNAEEMSALIDSDQFRICKLERSFGNPPQALVIVAERTSENAS